MSAKRILVVDDDCTVRLMLRTTLEAEGYHVVTLDRADALASAVAAHRPDLILLDLIMESTPVDGEPVAEYGGLAAVAQLQGQDGPPVVLMSSYLSGPRGEKVAQAAQALGVQAFLPKPFEMDELLALVEKTC